MYNEVTPFINLLQKSFPCNNDNISKVSRSNLPYNPISVLIFIVKLILINSIFKTNINVLYAISYFVQTVTKHPTRLKKRKVTFLLASSKYKLLVASKIYTHDINCCTASDLYTKYL